MSQAPRVSVIVAVYNGERYLPAALNSLLGQTFTDFELIVVDDNSRDGTPAVLARYAAADPRVIVLRNEANLGPFGSANRALDLARGEIIVRMDADDIAEPDRVARQVAFLDGHPDHVFVASSYRAMDSEGRIGRTKILAADHFRTCWILRFRQGLPHPGLAFRARLADGTAVRYSESYPIAQDCEFFARMSGLGKGAVLAAPLIRYRTHASNISSTRTAEQLRINIATAAQVRARELPADIAQGMDALVEAYLRSTPATAQSVRDGVAAMDVMLAHDIATQPQAKAWLMRQAAGVLAETCLRRGGGARRPAVLLAFLRHGWRYMPSLAMRLAEDRGWLPRALVSWEDPA